MIPPPLPESEIQARVMRALSQDPDVRIFRNQVGLAWQGDYCSNKGGILILRNSRPIKFGLIPGSADAIGWKTITITPQDVGKRFAVFTSIEIKKISGRPSDAQINWLDVTTAAGAFSGIARSPEQALAIVARP